MEIDDALDRWADRPAPPRLDGIEDRVLARLSAAPAPRTLTGAAFAVAAAFALALGIASNALPAPAQAAAPIGTPAGLAPSTLLDVR
ncbi:hypothetical protein [Sphingomonas endophytica]|uniref:Uncharacterized protein n=1 Tax=Sphingomonas endophytica TaxID=869719 RepID=A0A147I7R7_9SPHN|nr:hypothetical protein [Sphingomonas endophytica]KTT75023.1 hypothetical protein NS334_04055 [Sphingomonas endophytica]